MTNWQVHFFACNKSILLQFCHHLLCFRYRWRGLHVLASFMVWNEDWRSHLANSRYELNPIYCFLKQIFMCIPWSREHNSHEDKTKFSPLENITYYYSKLYSLLELCIFLGLAYVLHPYKMVHDWALYSLQIKHLS